MTASEVKQALLECQEIKKQNDELKHQNEILTKTLFSAGIEVDEKFGDNGQHSIVIPAQEELDKYTDLNKR